MKINLNLSRNKLKDNDMKILLFVIEDHYKTLKMLNLNMSE